MTVTDDEIRESIATNQLRVQQERGTDVTVFSPRASWMGHHVGNASTSQAWTEHCNELIRRVCSLFPDNFVPVCQLPQSPVTPIETSVAELRRCVEEMGFIGCNLNPDPSGGYWRDLPLGDRYWYPLYETMCELDVPAMIHVSGACHPAMHTTSSYYLGADTTAFVHFMMSDVFADFPTIKFIIPHGGGAVPYHWGRFRGMAQDMGLGDLNERVLGNVFFDTCVYHQDGIDMLTKVIPTENILFASEMVGAVRGVVSGALGRGLRRDREPGGKRQATLNRLLFPGPTNEFEAHRELYGDTSQLSANQFFYGLRHGYEHRVQLEKGVQLLIGLEAISDADERGMRTVMCIMNGQLRPVVVRDRNIASEVPTAEKADRGDPDQVAAPFAGVVTVTVALGDAIEAGQTIATIEAMKMEAGITAPKAGTVEHVAVSTTAQVEGGDLLVILS